MVKANEQAPDASSRPTDGTGTRASSSRIGESSGNPSPRGKVTSYDVARVAGVSQSAVSRCFKPGASVSKKMRARVMDAARKLGYQPNAIARSLITRRTHLVGVIMSDFTNQYYPEVLFELNHALAADNIHVLLFTRGRDLSIEDVFEQLWQYRVDGVIAAVELDDAQIRGFENSAIPLVLLNHTDPSGIASAVCCDQAAGEQALVDGLVAAGHRAFGILTGPPESSVGQKRAAGARECLESHGIEDIRMIPGDYTYDSGAAGMRVLADRGGRPDAVICANDVMAIGAIDVARHELGLAVPGELSIVGFDGIAPGQWLAYQLSTVEQPIRAMARAAAQIIFERIEDPAIAAEVRYFKGSVKSGNSARLEKAGLEPADPE